MNKKSWAEKAEQSTRHLEITNNILTILYIILFTCAFYQIWRTR